MSAEPSIGTRTLRGMIWAYSSYVGGRLLVLVSTAILARILDPSDFGLVALALLGATLLDTISDLGVGQALILEDEDTVLSRADTAWSFSVLMGTGLTLASAALAPLAALFFHERELLALVPALGFNFFLRGLGSTHMALAQRRLDFRTRTVAEMADVVVRGLAGIALALAGFGAWSLVLGYLIGTVALDIALFLSVSWRPSPRIVRSQLRRLVRFGGAFTGLDIIGALLSNADYITVGRVLGPAELGLYTLGFRLPELLLLNLSVVAAAVLFPALAAVEDRGYAFQVALRYTLMLGLPIAAALVIYARPIVLALFGEKWEASISVMQVLVIYALAAVIGVPAGSAYKAMGKIRILYILAVPRAVIVIPLLVLFAHRGIVWVAAAMSIGAAVIAVSGLLIARRQLSVSGRRILATFGPPLAATAGMVAVIVPIRVLVPGSWPQLVAGGIAGAAAYLGMLTLVAPDALRDLRAKLMPARAV